MPSRRDVFEMIRILHFAFGAAILLGLAICSLIAVVSK